MKKVILLVAAVGVAALSYSLAPDIVRYIKIKRM